MSFMVHPLCDPETRKMHKITIIEGPDGCGKSTMVRNLKEGEHDGIDLRVIRFPDNHGKINFRDLILSKEMQPCQSAAAFLFISDFIYTFDTQITPYLDDDNVAFVFDRFIPSTCVYQGMTADWFNALFGLDQFKRFTDVFAEAYYIYLMPPSFDELKRRLSLKTGDEINYLDPVGDAAIQAQVEAYSAFSHNHRVYGLLGSKNVHTLTL